MASSLYRPVEIGHLSLPGNLFLAPLAGFTDRAFRAACVDWKADLTYTEMISCEAVSRDNLKTLRMMERDLKEKVFAIQLFSGTVEAAEASLERVLSYSPSLIDLNCGCPVPKIIKSGAGSALMQNPGKIGAIVKALTRQKDVPVTVKIRTGWDSHSLNYLKAAEEALKGGASAVAMHGRTRSQGYSGKSDWNSLKILKREISVPVFGSGDLFSADDARRMLEETGIDGVMFARGAIGNPFIFSETRHLLQTGEHLPPHTVKEKLSTAINQYHYSLRFMDEIRASKEIRKHLCAYTKGIPGSSALRNDLVHADSAEEYDRLFDDFLKKLDD